MQRFLFVWLGFVRQFCCQAAGMARKPDLNKAAACLSEAGVLFAGKIKRDERQLNAVRAERAVQAAVTRPPRPWTTQGTSTGSS